MPIPEIVFEGERDQWPYLVITRLDGRLGSEMWPDLPEDQKERVLFHIGETIADVQRVPLGDLSQIEPRWDQFIPRQQTGPDSGDEQRREFELGVLFLLHGAGEEDQHFLQPAGDFAFLIEGGRIAALFADGNHFLFYALHLAERGKPDTSVLNAIYGTVIKFGGLCFGLHTVLGVGC